MEATLATQVLSFIVPAVSFGKSWVYGNKWKWAPAYGIIVQLGWMGYAWSLGYENVPGMILLSHALFIMEIRNLCKWLKN